jgi:Leucine-rich repeat (LRR) protein
MKLKVYARTDPDVPDRVLGFTPTRPGRPLRIPPGCFWYVRPVGALNGVKLDRLAGVVERYGIPGLDLSDHWELTNASLLHFRHLKKLQMLDISRTRLSDPALRTLRSVSGLRILLLPENVTDHGLADLDALRHLKELNLDRTRVTDAGLLVVKRWPTLERLDTSATRITDAGISLLGELPNLKRLVLNGRITDASAKDLRKLKSLEQIDISQTQIREEGLEALASLPRLKTVYANRLTTDEGLRRLSQSRSLRALDVTWAAITDRGTRHLATMKTLEEVALSQTGVGNDCLPELAKVSGLRMLELSGTRVTSAGLAPLAGLKKLEFLSLSWQTLTREDLQGMSKLKQLKTIILNGVPLPATTMAQLKRLGLPRQVDVLTLAKPVPPPTRSLVVPGRLPEVPKTIREPAMQPLRPVSIPLAKATTAEISTTPAAKVIPVAKAVPVVRLIAPPRVRPSAALEEAPKTPLAPAQAAGRQEPEEVLLKSILRESNPSRGGAFSGLAAMKQLRQTQTLASINEVSPGSRSSIRMPDDKPENFLGEFNVDARHR